MKLIFVKISGILVLLIFNLFTDLFITKRESFNSNIWLEFIARYAKNVCLRKELVRLNFMTKKTNILSKK